jgi:hypothetical protein
LHIGGDGVLGRHCACAHPPLRADRHRALGPCRYLTTAGMPDTQARLGGYRPIVVGGDLNPTDRGSPNVADCRPAGSPPAMAASSMSWPPPIACWSRSGRPDGTRPAEPAAHS